MAGHACRKCQELETIPDETGRSIRLPRDLLDDIVLGKDKSKKGDQVDDFCKSVNALMNNGTGIAVLHTEEPHLFGLFSQVVGSRISGLVSDNSCYAGNFEVNFEDDYHIIFRVKPIVRRPWSVLSFNTNLSHDKGQGDPTHGQLRQLLQSSDSVEDSGSATRQLRIREPIFLQKEGRNEIKFKETIESDDAPIVKKFIFHEAVGIEAKGMTGCKMRSQSGTQRPDTVFEYMWDFLPKYITSFSKLSFGGSVYFGVKEETKKEGKKEWNTGKFLYEEVLELDEDEQNKLREKICTAAETRLLWHPKFPGGNPVQVEFHDTGRRRNKCYIVEVVVGRFPGCVFLESDGPESYMLRKRKLVRVSGDDCIRKLKRRRQEE